MGKLKNGKDAGKDEIRGEMIKGGGNRVVDWIWRLCNMAFESGVVAQDWKSAVIVQLYKGKREMTKCSNYALYNYFDTCGWKNVCMDPSRLNP